MPPKVKITKEDIVQAALDIVRQSGPVAINARTLASALNCSTQPIFSNFATMEELHQAVANKAQLLYQEYTDREMASQAHPAYKASGMAYIRFAKEERELFKLLFMCDQSEGSGSTNPNLFDDMVTFVQSYTGLSHEEARLFHLELWACVHGIATMFATGFLDLPWELVSRMTSDVYLGLRTQYERQES